MKDSELIDLAKSLVNPMPLARSDMDAATVGSAILSDSGKVFTGVCIHVSCGIGFCAEHAAVAEMIKGGETKINTIVAAKESEILTPCGRCRELFVQVNKENLNTRVLINESESKTVNELLPNHWL